MKLRAIRRGETYAAITRDGTGVFRTRAASDGVIVDLPSEDLFLSLDVLMSAVRALREIASPHEQLARRKSATEDHGG